MLTLDKIDFAYGTKTVLKNFSCTLEAGQIASLLGPSGCGKSTVIRLLAGFDEPQHGSITLDGQCITGPGVFVPPQHRHIGVVFQDYALFRTWTLLETLGLDWAIYQRSKGSPRVQEMLTLVGLNGQASAWTHQLSGGQQQRVALARALAPKPRVLLLDEPFSSLDVDLRERLASEVRDILKHEGITAIWVTHDQNEAFAVADVVGIMQHGAIAQWDTAYKLYHEPNSRFVADFVGQGVFLQGVTVDSSHVDCELGRLGTVHTSLSRDSAEFTAGSEVLVLIRPDDIVHDDGSTLMAEVERKAFRGAQFLYTLKLDSGSRVLSLVPSHHNHHMGEKIGIKLEVDHVVVFAP